MEKKYPGEFDFEIHSTSMGLSLMVYQSDRNKPDRVVNGNNVVVSNRVAGRWRVDGQSGAERIGDNRERDN